MASGNDTAKPAKGMFLIEDVNLGGTTTKYAELYVDPAFVSEIVIDGGMALVTVVVANEKHNYTTTAACARRLIALKNGGAG